VPTVGFGEQAEIAIFVEGKRIVKGLEELPYVRLGRPSRVYVESTVADTEAGAKGLVEVKHVGDVVPTVHVRCDAAGGFVCEEARSILLEKTDQAAATGSTVKPKRQGRCRGIIAGLEEPEEESLRNEMGQPGARSAKEMSGPLTLLSPKSAYPEY
jgi:hypothetical protein